MECLLPVGILVQLIISVSGSGKFEVSMLAIYNKFGIKENGHCCNGSRDLPPCSMECQTFFSICLFHYVTELADDPTCTYGQTSTPVLGGNSINKSSFLSLNYFPVTMSFDFSWPRSFSLVIDANHDANNNVSATDRSQRILRIFVVDDLKPSSNWIFKDLRVNQSHVWFKYRVVCDEYYYGPSCEVFCRDRDDRFGHYVCNENGTKTCLPGWDGYFCQQAICSSSCNSSHGYCEEPYECRCRYGWTGLSCDQCLTNPGCIHGTCERPGECICNDGWIGKKCDIDLMYCVKHKPCLNGGTCTIDMFSNYSCSCLEGFNGRNCQNSVCNEIQCRNGGVCQIEGNKTLCKCRENFYGEQCQNTKVSCDDIQCLNKGTCYFGEFGAMCTCEKGYTGIFCEREINECDSHPCVNGATCRDGYNDYTCQCPRNYGGKNCELYLNPCEGYCLNKGTCSVSHDGYAVLCACQDGYSGPRCESQINPCKHVECKNGGMCTFTIKSSSFACNCKSGYEGRFCEVIDPCEKLPCFNGGTCKRYTNHSICLCPQQYGGPQCDVLLYPSDQSVTQAPPTTFDVNATSSMNSSIKKLVIISVIAVTTSCLIVVLNTRRWTSCNRSNLFC